MTTLEIARYYLSLGLNVIPWKHGVKGGGQLVPWHYYQYHKVTDNDLVQWFDGKDVGIAIVTGKISGITVIDDDNHGDSAPRFITPLMAYSGGGGRHYYYAYCPALKTGVNKNLHLDVRNDGALIYVYPTIHPSGKQYTWEDGIESVQRVPELLDVPLTDPLIVSYMQEKVQDDNEKEVRVYTEGYGEYFNVGQGGRDATLKDFCLQLWKKGMSASQVYSLALLVDKTYSPPLGADVVKQKVDSTFKALGEKKDYTIKLGGSSLFKSYKGTGIQKAYDAILEKYGDGLSTGSDLLDVHFRLYPQHLYMITGGTHIGKTTVAADIALSVAKAGKKVLFFSLEDGLYIAPKLTDVPDTFELIDCTRFPKPSEISSYIKALPEKPDVLFVDHIHFLAPDEKTESMKDRVAGIASTMKMLCKQLDIPIVNLVHIRKQEKKQDTPPTIDDMKDAQELGGLANVVCILHRKRKAAEEVGADSEYFEKTGQIYIAKAKVPNGRQGAVNFTIEDNKITYEKRYASTLIPLEKPDHDLDF